MYDRAFEARRTGVDGFNLIVSNTMKSGLVLSLLLLAPSPVLAQAHDHAPDQATRQARLFDDLGNLHHPIQTRSAEAQKYFDQGLTLVYGFNHEEAILSFRKAAELDPRSPMPHWGIALALGPNINSDVDPEREKAAYDAAQQARRLAARAAANERAYVDAIVIRYSNDPKADLKALAVRYKDAMAALVKRYPDDLDAATLYAESLMNLRPWQLYANDGTPAEGTTEIVEVLESVLARNPTHVGANHYYIHATEASLAPERALRSAKRLETLVPGAGHLVHMPAHTYMRTGNYSGALEANAKAAAVDRRYIDATKADGLYPAMYYNHNLDFLASAAMMTGQFDEAMKAAQEVVSNVKPMIADMAMLEPFGAKTLYVLLRFNRSNEILQLAAPAATAPLLTPLYHFGRGVAHARLGNVAEARRDREAYQAATQAVPADTAWLYNSAAAIFTVADAVLDARIAAADGNGDAAIAAWEKAVAAEDRLNYDEPADWFYPTRESLGAALIKAGRWDDARRVFREDLERNVDNPRSLFGLWNAMIGSDPRDASALAVNRRFNDAWKSEQPLTLDDY